MLATVVADHPFQWEDHVRTVCIAYNTSSHSTNGYAPFYLMYGRQARMPVDLMYGSPKPEVTSTSEYVFRLRKNLESAYQQVRHRLDHVLEQQKDLYDQKVHGRPLEVKELVWLHCPAVPKGKIQEATHIM